MTPANPPIPRLAALQHRDFRLLWIGQIVSVTGTQMQNTAVDWHVYQLLRSETYTLSLFGASVQLGAGALGLGALGLVRVVPIILFALVGGMVADSADRRRVLVWSQTLAAVFAGALAVLTFGGRETVAAIYLLTAAIYACAAFANPARQALIPNLVPREHLANAVSLTNVMWQLGLIVGPALAGILLARTSAGLIYALNGLSFLVVVAALLMMHYRSAAPQGGTGLGWDSLMEGLKFTYRQRLIWSTMLLDFFATFFSSARTMLPIIASDVLNVGVQGFGLLSAAQPLGAVIAGGVLSFSRQIRRQGMVLLVSVLIYGLATALFGWSTAFALSFLMLAITGSADTVSTVIRATLRQLVTPDHLRGRMSGTNMIFFMGGPQLGEMEAGLVAALVGAPLSIITGGVATVLLTLWVAWRYPVLRRYLGEEQAEASGAG